MGHGEGLVLFFLFPFESAVFQGIFDCLKGIQNSLLLPPLLQDGLHSLEGGSWGALHGEPLLPRAFLFHGVKS